tara:strand:+ start:2097 stop:2432 length:336 start_codon:yes stop_codon:yes gene_type:complete
VNESVKKEGYMPAYIVVEAVIRDMKKFVDYAAAVPALVTEMGGKYLVLGGASEQLEGDWGDTRIVIHEWPTLAQAKAFWFSEAYTQLKAHRKGTGEFRVILVDGRSEQVLE